MAFSILYWANYTAGTRKLSRKSEIAVQSDHVLKFVYDKEASYVRGTVQASMRDRSYNVTDGEMSAHSSVLYSTT